MSILVKFQNKTYSTYILDTLSKIISKEMETISSYPRFEFL